MVSPESHSLLSGSRSSRRDEELDAAFDSDDDDDTLDRPVASASNDGPPGYDAATHTSSTTTSRSQQRQPVNDIFFDAGEAMHDEPPPPPRQNITQDPLGATGSTPTQSDSTHRLASTSLSGTANTLAQSAYDFEDASYFNGSRSQPRSRSASFVGASLGSNPHASTSRIALGSTASGAPTQSGQTNINAQGLARVRVMLGRFGRFVGMRVPGANYSTLAQDDSQSSQGVTRSRRVMGGGMNQDGVFGNLNAKPEGRRRRQANGGNPDDRGDDDDLEDDVLPPTYEVAAADAAPGYWETTIAPGGLGWTPGGAHIGDVEDLILEGLPIGNFFGFAWNLLISMCFQFVGFLLTYLLHTTHAARCGSRAGLGITLIQYGFYLRTRALQLADEGAAGGSNGDGGAGGGAMETHTIEFWGGDLVYTGPAPATAAAVLPMMRDAATATVSSSSLMPTPTGENGMAAAMASQADTLPMDSNTTATSEWLAYMLMIIGWFILLSSLLSYWRVHRWGRALVAASRREQESQRAAENGGEAPETTEEAPPIGFMHRLRAAMRARAEARAAGRTSGTGEDWVIFPGSTAGSRGVSANATGSMTTMWGAPPRQGLLQFAIGDDDEDEERQRHLTNGETHLSPEEQRLLADIRRGGLA